MAFQSHEQKYRDHLKTKYQRDKNFVSSGDKGKWIKFFLHLWHGVVR